MCRIDERYQDKGYRNWLSCVNGLRALRCLLRTFLEEQTQQFHQGLVDNLATDTCINQCEIKKNIKPNELPDVCEVCTHWSYELLDNHSAQGSRINWHNCNPQRWPTEKWEVAKVYMPGGHKTHVKFDDFDIAALVNLMSHCTHFHRLINVKELQQILNDVTYVRNQVMHSPGFTISSEDLKKHLQKIRNLGQALESYAPEMECLSEEIDKGTREQSLEEFRQMELLSMKEEMNCVFVSFSGVHETDYVEGSKDTMKLVERLCSFMLQYPDLQATLSVQVAYLYWMMENKKQLMQALAKVDQQQKTLYQYQQENHKQTQDKISDTIKKYEQHNAKVMKENSELQEKYLQQLNEISKLQETFKSAQKQIRELQLVIEQQHYEIKSMADTIQEYKE